MQIPYFRDPERKRLLRSLSGYRRVDGSAVVAIEQTTSRQTAETP